MSIKYAYHETSQNAGLEFYGNNWLAQTFIAPCDFTVTMVELGLTKTGSPGTITVSIKATDKDNKPTGDDLCSRSFSANVLPDNPSWQWHKISFDESADLTEGNYYAIVIRAPDGDDSNDGFWVTEEPPPDEDEYPFGALWGSSNGGATWTQGELANLDFDFAVYGDPEPLIYFCDTTALAALQQLEQITLGCFYIDERGYAVWEGRNHRSKNCTESQHTFSNTMQDIDYSISDRFIYNEVVATIQGRTASPFTVIWECPDLPMRFPWGGLEYEAALDTPAICILELESGNDFILNMMPDGSGEDVTYCLSLNYQTNYASKVAFKLDWDCWFCVHYLTTLQLRGAPLQMVDYMLVRASDQTSIDTYGKRSKYVSIPWLLSAEYVENTANYIVSHYKEPIPEIKMEIVGRDDTLLEQILTLQISDRITVVNTALGLNAEFYINKMEHEVLIGGLTGSEQTTLHRIVYTLEKITGTRAVWIIGTSEIEEDTVIALS